MSILISKMGSGFDGLIITDISDSEEKPIGRGKGRPKIYQEGAKQHEKDTKYSSTYYKTHKDKKCICMYCDKEIVQIYKQQHYRSKTCQRIKAIKENLQSQ